MHVRCGARAVMSPLPALAWPVSKAVSLLGGPRLSILIFHRVLAQPDPLQPSEPDAASFARLLGWLGASYQVLPLSEATRRLTDGGLPTNAACITFDDGYADNLTVAAPILVTHRMTATFFIATGFLDGGRMFNDTVIESVRAHRGDELNLEAFGLGRHATRTVPQRLAAIGNLLDQVKYLPQPERDARVADIAATVGLAQKSDLMMTRGQVRDLRRRGMSIGGHTISHPILTRLTQDEARREIEEGRRDLEEIVGDRVRTFAYPNGKPQRDYDASHVAIVKELGFDAAVSTSWGASKRDTDRFQLPRFTPWDRHALPFRARLAQNRLRAAQLA
jgi:peptidoglycan/xylan/chitin deacetylase (PgdA/CDA1 family)